MWTGLWNCKTGCGDRDIGNIERRQKIEMKLKIEKKTTAIVRK